MIRFARALVPRRMKGFTHDGSAHRDGIRNEHFVIEHLRRTESTIGQRVCPAPLTIAHQGGTQTKADAVVSNGTTVSIKHHKHKGTFDWINTTKHVPYDADVRAGLARVSDTFKVHQNVEQARDEVSAVFATALARLKDDDAWIRSLLRRVYDEYPDALVVTVEHRKQLVYIPKQSLTQFTNEAAYSLKHKAGTTSATIMMRDGDAWRSTSMRIRLVLNNGVNALLKLSSANRSSVPTVKIQQDDVDDWLESLDGTLTESYAVEVEAVEAAEKAKLVAAVAAIATVPAEPAEPVAVPAEPAEPVVPVAAVPVEHVEPIAVPVAAVPAEPVEPVSLVEFQVPASPLVKDVAEMSRQIAQFVL